jgi:O-antigen/teichoic acid export membrane protein
MPSTRQQFLRGSFWAALGFGFGQVLRLASNLILARLLVREDPTGTSAFGLMALVNVFLAGLQMFSDIGVGPSIIHNQRGDDRSFLNTAFTMQAGRGIILFVLSCAIAYPFPQYPQQPDLIWLIPASAFSVLFAGLNSTSLWTLTRHIQQGKVTALRTFADVIAALVSIVWAFIHPSVWALVGGVLARTIVTAVASHFLIPDRNRLEWDREAFKELYRYGRMIFLSTATFFLAGQGERLILGKYLADEEGGMSVLGVFHIAQMLATFAALAVIEVNNRVLFPTVARSLRENRAMAMRQYAKARAALAVIALLMAMGLIFIGPWFVRFTLPPEYQDATWMLQIMATLAVFNVSGGTIVSLLMADARLSYAVTSNLSRFAVIAFGLVWALETSDFRTAMWVIGLSPIPSYLVYVWGLKRHFPEAVKEEVGFAVAMVLTLIACYRTALIPS